MKFKVRLLSLAIATTFIGLVGCNSNTDTDSNVEMLNGIAIDGYLDQLRICYDSNLNKVNDNGETCAFSSIGSDGIARYSLPLQEGIPLVGEVIAGQTIDLDNPGQFIDDPNTTEDDGNRFSFQAPAGSTLISPLTTVLQQRVEDNPGIPLADLEVELLANLGIVDENISVFDDYVALSHSTDTTVTEAANVIHDVSRVVTKILATNTNQAINTAGNPSDNATVRGIFDVINTEISDSLSDIAARIKDLNSQGNPIETVITLIEQGGDFDFAVANDASALNTAVALEIQNNIDNGNAPTDGNVDPATDGGSITGATGATGG